MNTTAFAIKFAKKRRIDDIIQSGKYDEVNFLINDGVKKGRLTMDDEVIGDRKIILIQADNNISSQEILVEAARMGLSRPTHGSAFLFGEQHPDEQKQGPIIFLHDPPHYWSGHSFNLSLNVNRYKKRILTFVSSGGWWQSGYRFAFEEK